MTYTIPVDARGQSVIVQVDAHSEQTAQEVARWLVSHSRHLQAHATPSEAGRAISGDARGLPPK